MGDWKLGFKEEIDFGIWSLFIFKKKSWGLPLLETKRKEIK